MQENTAYIEHSLPNGCVTMIDADDAWLLRHYTPYVSGYGIVGNDYRVRLLCSSSGKSVSLARAIIDCHDPMLFVDHANHNTLDNRRHNLRVATRSQNNANRRAWGQLPKGISYDPWKDLYRARIQVNGKRIGLGRFKNLEDACAAYNRAAKEHFGVFATISNPEDYV